MNLESSIDGLDWADQPIIFWSLVRSGSASCFVKLHAVCSVYHVCLCYIHICIISHLAFICLLTRFCHFPPLCVVMTLQVMTRPPRLMPSPNTMVAVKVSIRADVASAWAKGNGTTWCQRGPPVPAHLPSPIPTQDLSMNFWVGMEETWVSQIMLYIELCFLLTLDNFHQPELVCWGFC